MSVQMNTKTPVAILARIDEIIRELESLKGIVLDEMIKESTIDSTISTAQRKFVPRPGSITAELWGSLGQGTLDELEEIFAYDYDYELSSR